MDGSVFDLQLYLYCLRTVRKGDHVTQRVLEETQCGFY